MGMGEPLFNYDNVIKSIHILRDRKGLDFPTDGRIKTDEPRTLDFSGVRGFLVTNVCIVQRSAA